MAQSHPMPEQRLVLHCYLNKLFKVQRQALIVLSMSTIVKDNGRLQKAIHRDKWPLSPIIKYINKYDETTKKT